METRANYVLIGAFVLFAAAALMLFTLWVAGTPLNRNYATYDVVFEGPVNGLTEGGEVRFNGIKVGEVTNLSLDRKDPNRVIARIKIDAETPVRTDSKAQLDFLGITGVTFIQILAGDPNSQLVKVDNFKDPPVIKTERTALDQIFSGGQNLLTLTSDTLANLKDALSAENVKHVTNILASVDKAAAKFAADGGVIDNANEALKSINKAATALASASTSVDEAAKTIGTKVSDFAGNADQLVADLKPAIKNAQQTMESLNSAVGQINKELTPTAGRALEQISLAAVDLQAMMVRVQGLLNEIEQDPSRFLYRQPDPVE